MGKTAEVNDTSKTKRTAGAAVLVGALGVVYGDIGTSPLYTIKASLAGYPNPTHEHILGVLSILFWLLMVVASLK